MRIIDCSSGVCSSDLLQQCRECARGYLGKIVLHDLPSAHGEPLRPCGNEALGDRLADDASMLFREGLQLSRVAADDRGRDLKAITRCQGELAHLALGTLRCADGVHPPGASGFRPPTLQETATLLHRDSPKPLRSAIAPARLAAASIPDALAPRPTPPHPPPPP